MSGIDRGKGSDLIVVGKTVEENRSSQRFTASGNRILPEEARVIQVGMNFMKGRILHIIRDLEQIVSIGDSDFIDVDASKVPDEVPKIRGN